MEYKKDGFSNQRSIVVPRSVQEMQATNELTRLLYVTRLLSQCRGTLSHP